MDKSTADKMTSMMLGTFTNGTGISSSPENYVMAGKTGTTETVLIQSIQVTNGLLDIHLISSLAIGLDSRPRMRVTT